MINSDFMDVALDSEPKRASPVYSETVHRIIVKRLAEMGWSEPELSLAQRFQWTPDLEIRHRLTLAAVAEQLSVLGG